MENKSIKLLALEDSPWDMELISKQLIGAGFDIKLTHVDNEKEYAEALQKDAFDLILSDFALPGFDAFAALELRNKLCPHTPFICISGSIGEEMAVKLLKQGAVDYILKDRPERLPHAINRALDETRKLTEKKQAEQNLYKTNKSLESFLKISQTINTTMDPDQVLQMVVDNATEVMGLNSGAIYQLEDETLRLLATTPPLSENFPEHLRLANLHEHPHVKKAITTGKPVIMADTLKTNLTPAEAEIVKMRNLRSNLYLPIQTKNHTMGVLILTSTEKIHEFGKEEIKHIQGFANQAAHIIENARNYKEIQSYARALEKEIAERKKAEEAIKASEEKYRFMFENNPQVMWIYDLETLQFLEINKAAIKKYGYSREEFLRMTLMDIRPKEDIERLMEDIHKTRKELNEAGQWRHRKKNGEVVHVEIISHSILFNNRDARHVLVHDVTERIEAEKTRRELEIARKTAKFKQNFMAKMSHEIRTPLTGVMGMIDILEQTTLDEVQKDYLDTIKISGENLKEIINQVLDYSKIEAGKISINPTVFKFQTLPENARLLYINCMQAGVNFYICHDPDIPEFIQADNSRLSQVLNNLVSNAVKFTSEGSVTIRSTLLSRQPDSDNLTIKLEVSDTGKGIPEDLREKLFNPFVQGTDGDNKENEGTGLGLSICKELVKLMGGDIDLISEPGVGSTFWFTFSATAAKEIIAKEKESIIPLKQKKLRVLVTEDTIVIQKIVRLMLQTLGHEVVLANNGKQALELYEPGKFDIILMDVQMPVMDGITATLMLKEKYKDLPPIIGLSANAFEGDREKYMAQGMDEYLTKPVKKTDFEMLIKELLL